MVNAPGIRPSHTPSPLEFFSSFAKIKRKFKKKNTKLEISIYYVF
jgi:hypothetical protein